MQNRCQVEAVNGVAGSQETLYGSRVAEMQLATEASSSQHRQGARFCPHEPEGFIMP